MQTCFEEIPHCEIFYPTMNEFENFSEYLEKASKIAKSGIFKVIPPKGWKARKDDYKNLDFVIPHPIEQIVAGNEGFYELFLLQRESRLLSRYEKLVKSFDKITENKKPVDVEKLFWRTLKFSSPLYGADAPGSLFDKGAPWNLSEIDSILKQGLDYDITGVTTPYLYIGSWKSMFAWHKEDLDLYSINFLHFGKPKCWYGIPQEKEKEFEEFASKYFSEASKECKEFLRHKTYMINPSIIQESGLTVNKCIQYPGEFVITKSAGYHAGFNMGFNCAEAVNFALKNWLDYAKNANYCKCQKDSVKIDINSFEHNLKNTEKKEKRNEEKFLKEKTKREKLVVKKNFLDKSHKKIKKNIPAYKKTKKLKTIENWLCCDSCNKWRKIPKNGNYDLEIFKNGFYCNFIKNLDCNYAEENWRSKYTTLKRINSIDINISKKDLKNYLKRMKDSINV